MGLLAVVCVRTETVVEGDTVCMKFHIFSPCSDGLAPGSLVSFHLQK